MDLNAVGTIAVIGASTNPRKYGNIVLRFLVERGYEVYPVNPKHDEIEGLRCFRDVTELPSNTDLLVFIVPPKVGLEVATKAISAGFNRLWFQPGAESEEIVALLRRAGVEYSVGRCIMVELSGEGGIPTPEV